MINNNTKDIAYLGWHTMEKFCQYIWLIDSRTEMKLPPYHSLQVGVTSLFDCNGCRYGFRIKELKSKAT